MTAHERIPASTAVAAPRRPGYGVLTDVDQREFVPSPAELAELVSAIASTRDRQAFAALYRHFAPRVKTYALRLGLRAAEAEELAQETLLAVWRKAALFDASKAGASTWIFTIARNLIVDGRRRSIRSPLVESDAGSEAPSDDATPEANAIATQRDQRVRAAIARLSPDQQAVIRLSYFSESPQTDIAETLGIPLGTVKSRVRLATEKLRAYLDELQ